MISAYFDLNVFDYLRRYPPSTRDNRHLHSNRVQIYTSFTIYEELLPLSLSDRIKFEQVYKWIKELRMRNIYSPLVPYIYSDIRRSHKRKERLSPYISGKVRRKLLSSYPYIVPDSEAAKVIDGIRNFKDNFANDFNSSRDRLRSDPKFQTIAKPQDIAQYAHDYAHRWIADVRPTIEKNALHRIMLQDLLKSPAMIIFSKHFLSLECQMTLEGRSCRPSDFYDLFHSVYASRVDYFVTQDMDRFGARHNQFVKPFIKCAPAIDLSSFSRIINLTS